MRVLITGAQGQLGKEVYRQLSQENSMEITLCDVDTLDISNSKAVSSFCEKIQPELIINCAAYTAVDKCEEEIDLAYKVNAIGPRNLAINAEKYSAKLIHISTDYVFDGDGNRGADNELRPYMEFDELGPQSIYGASKAQGEAFVKDFCSRYFIVRTAWLYGDGANFVKTMLELSEKYDSLKVVNDQKGSPTSTRELTKGIISLIDSEAYGIYHGTCEGECTWYDFTCRIFEIKDIKTQVVPCTSDEYPRPAKRPSYSVLDNMMFRLEGKYQFSHWNDAIEEYLRGM